MMWILSMHKS